MEWFREENRRLTRMSFLSSAMLLITVIAAIVSGFKTDGHLQQLLVGCSILMAFITGSASAAERATVAACVRIKRLEDRIEAMEKDADN